MTINNLEMLLMIVFLGIGYLFGFLHANQFQQQNTGHRQNIKNTKLYENLEKVSIDDKTFVVDIDTSKMEKKFTNLGEIKHSEENISGSIQKLKNIKG